MTQDALSGYRSMLFVMMFIAIVLFIGSFQVDSELERHGARVAAVSIMGTMGVLTLGLTDEKKEIPIVDDERKKKNANDEYFMAMREGGEQ